MDLKYIIVLEVNSLLLPIELLNSTVRKDDCFETPRPLSCDKPINTWFAEHLACKDM